MARQLSEQYHLPHIELDVLYWGPDWTIQEDFLDPKSDLIESDPEWRDVHQFRFGFEYQIGMSWGVIPVRAGFRTEPLPFSHQINAREALADPTVEDVTFDRGDQVVGQVFTLGSGLQWGQVRVDLTWEYASNTLFRSGFLTDGFLKPQLILERENRTQRLLLGFTGYF